MSDQLTKLFNDKLAIKPIAEVKTVEKKIKKKDVIVPDFKDSMLPFI
jgi:hypothetical protein